MKTLKLFNAVIAKPSKAEVFVSDEGYVIQSDAMWAKDNIVAFYAEQKLSGNDLNKTFHKSWEKVISSSRYELLVEQIRHYLSTYGTDLKGEIYIPDEELEVPGLELKYTVIKSYCKTAMTKKCLGMLQSGIALTEETINDVLSVLVDELDYSFTGKEGIKNKEAIIKIADMYGILPTDTMEFFRYILFRATGESLLIKSPEMIAKIKDTNFNPAAQLKSFGLGKLAEIFNRFKPLFLAFKGQCPKVINKISKLSKSNHKPLVTNPLNLVTQRKLTDADRHWLDNATPFALFKALTACYNRMGRQTDFVYRIRNGKSWIADKATSSVVIPVTNFGILYDYLKLRFDLTGTKVLLPRDVEYAIPTSEKMFVGNVPTGTKFYGERLACGVYWRNDWGANDHDLSALDVQGGKIGWNSSYSDDVLAYSGDITNAPDGAVEYLYSSEGLSQAYLIMNNVYSGNPDAGYKIIVGRGDRINMKYMMNPNNLFMEVKCNSVQKQTVVGMLLPPKLGGVKQHAFVLLNFGAGHARVSGRNPQQAINALYQQWSNPLSFNELLLDLGVQFVDEADEADVDLSLDKLEKDTFTKLFEAQPELAVA
jgi:hypothetical protein